MPERRQTQGDFGIRPVKPQQQITDTYSAPRLPKPDTSMLDAIKGLSKTAFQVMDFNQKEEAYQQKQAKAFGEANPDFKPGEGTTEAAMIGLREGQGTALQARFRTQTEQKWESLTLQNENLKLDPDNYQNFLQGEYVTFIEENNIDGIARTSFDSGQGDWALEQIGKQNIAAQTYRNKLIKEDNKDITASALSSVSKAGIDFKRFETQEQVFGFMEALIDPELARLGLPQFEPVTMFDGSVKNLFELTPAELDTYQVKDSIRHNHLVRIAKQESLPLVQNSLDRAHRVGGSVFQETRQQLVNDLIDGMKSGENPLVVRELAESIKLGTGTLSNTAEYKSAYEKNKETIEDNIASRRYTNVRQLDMFKLSEDMNGSHTQEDLDKALADVEKERGYMLTDEQAFALSKTLMSNFMDSRSEANSLATLEYFDNIANGVTPDGNINELDATDVVQDAESKGIKISETQAVRKVEEALLEEADKLNFVNEDGTPDFGKRASYIVSNINVNGMFNSHSAKKITNELNLAANKILTGQKIDYTDVLKQYEMYKAVLNNKAFTRIPIKDNARSVYEKLRLDVEFKDTALEDAITPTNFEILKENIETKPTGVTRVQLSTAVKNAGLRSELMPVARELSNAIQMSNPMISGEDAAEEAAALLIDSGVTVIGGGTDYARTILMPTRLDRQPRNRTFISKHASYERFLQQQTFNQLQRERKSVLNIIDKFNNQPAYAESQGLPNKDAYVLEQHEKLADGDETFFLSRPKKRAFEREWDALVMRQAFEIWSEENDGNRALLESLEDDDINQTGLRTNNINWVDLPFGIVSTLGFTEEPSYSFVNLNTNAVIDIGGLKVDGLYGHEVATLLDEDVSEMSRLDQEIRKSVGKPERGSRGSGGTLGGGINIAQILEQQKLEEDKKRRAEGFRAGEQD